MPTAGIARAGGPVGSMRFVVPVVVAAAGLVGSRVAMPALAGWYADLAKPAIALHPAVVLPAWLLALATTVVAAWLAMRAPAGPRTLGRAMRAYWIQLSLSLGWVLIFFGARDSGWAFCEALILLAAQIVALLRFVAIDRHAGLLLLPALAWTAHATIAGFLIWQLNLRQ